MQMISLSNANLSRLGANVLVPRYDRSAVTEGIAHIGVGNFHRAHLAVYVDRCLHAPDQHMWGICGIGLSDTSAARSKASAFHQQDGLYTVTEFAPDGRSTARVVGAMLRYLHAPVDPAAVLETLASPNIKIVSLTITEGGYNIDEATGAFLVDQPDVAHDLGGGPPRTAFGFIVEALRRRRLAGDPAFAVVSCDNLRHNGDTARRAIVAFARARDPELAQWIDREVPFPNSMVDRIAPKVTDADRQRLNASSGVDDRLPVSGESFIQWVIEDRFPAGRPRFEHVGVELRDDVALFETVKGRLLNASHMLMSYPSILCGYRLVHEAMQDRRIAELIDQFIEHDAIPLLEGPPGLSLTAYKKTVLERFSNPAVGDQLLRIAHDGAAKIPVFHTKTLQALVAEGKELGRVACFLACFARYLTGRDDAGRVFEVHEPNISPSDHERLRDADELGLTRIAAFRALQLDQHPRFVEAYLDSTRTIARDGTARALQRAIQAAQ